MVNQGGFLTAVNDRSEFGHAGWLDMQRSSGGARRPREPRVASPRPRPSQDRPPVVCRPHPDHAGDSRQGQRAAGGQRRAPGRRLASAAGGPDRPPGSGIGGLQATINATCGAGTVSNPKMPARPAPFLSAFPPSGELPCGRKTNGELSLL